MALRWSGTRGKHLERRGWRWGIAAWGLFAWLACGAMGASERPDRVRLFDTRPLKRLDLAQPEQARRLWDTLHLVAALQGLVNRVGPRLYLLHVAEFGVETDEFWWEWYRGEDGWLRGVGSEELPDVDALLTTFRADYEGLVVYDGEVPATSNLASTAAGVERLLPVRWDSSTNSLFARVTGRLGLPVRLSFHAHYPLRSAYSQPNRRPTPDDWRARGFLGADGRVAARFFVGHYVGDYDAPSWVSKAVPSFFRDPARGRVPLGWAFDPNLADRAPQALAYAYRHATTNDYFIAGDSGAGDLNPRALTVRPDSGLGPALEVWVKYCEERYRRWDMTITGFLLDGAAGASTDLEFAAYRRLSPDGLGTHFERGPALRAGVPTCPERDLPDDAAEAARTIAGLARKSSGKPGFLWARSILKSPGWYAEVSRRLTRDHGELPIDVVDPYTFFGLIARVADGKAEEVR